MMWLDLFAQEFVEALATVLAFAAVFGLAWLVARLGGGRRIVFRQALRLARRNRAERRS